MIYLVSREYIPEDCFGMFERSEARVEDLQALVYGKIGEWQAALHVDANEQLDVLTGIMTPYYCPPPKKLNAGDLQLVLKTKASRGGVWTNQLSWFHYLGEQNG